MVEPLEARRLLSDATPLRDVGAVSTTYTPIVEAAGVGYFVANDSDAVLWRTDGSAEGTYPVKTLLGASGVNSSIYTLMEASDRLFIAERFYGSNHANLWVSDGTDAGTRVLASHAPAVDKYDFSNTVEVVGEQVFYVDGRTLMRTDGTDAGTVFVKRIDVAGTRVTHPSNLAAVNDTLFFLAGGGTQLWKSDGTTAGTTHVKDVFTYPNATTLVALGDRVMFYGADPSRTKGNIYVSDGRPVGTLQITRFDLKFGLDQVSIKRPVGGKMYFDIWSAGSLRGTWATDGTRSGTQQITPRPGATLGTVGETVFIGASPNASAGSDLYATDGTTGGTTLLNMINASPGGFGFRRIGEAGGFLYFAAADAEYNSELWRTDGTAAGTVIAGDLLPGTKDGSGPREGGTVGGAVLFFARRPSEGGTTLWRVLPRAGTISGQVFYDGSGDGVRAPTELGSAGWRVFIDKDADGIWDRNEPFTRTDSAGRYALGGLPAGNYRVAITPIGGWHVTTPSTFFVRLKPDGTPVRLFGVQPVVPEYGTVSGAVFDDEDRDGLPSAGESPLVGYRVFLDLDFDDQFDSGSEPFAFSGSDGHYFIEDVLPGRYHVAVSGAGGDRILTTPGVRSITVGANRASSADFGERYEPFTGVISGSTFKDDDGDGTRNAVESAVGGFRVFLDRNNNGAPDPGEPSLRTGPDGAFAFTGLGAGTHRLRQVPLRGDWRLNVPLRTINLPAGGVATHDFANAFEPSSVITGYIHFDANANGLLDFEPDERRWWREHLAPLDPKPPRVYVDVNRNGFYTPGEPVAQPDSTSGEFTIERVPAGTYQVRAILPDDQWLQTTGAVDSTVSLGSGHRVFRSILITRTASVNGRIFDDYNGNHRFDVGEPTLAGVGVYIDHNWNLKRDRNEPLAITDRDGRYAFTGLASGTHVVRINGVHSRDSIALKRKVVTLGSSDAITRDFPLIASARIRGQVYHDTDGDSLPDPTELRYVDQMVYLDTDNDGVFDADERSVRTDAFGNYVFGGLTPGKYVVRLANPMLNPSAKEAVLVDEFEFALVYFPIP